MTLTSLLMLALAPQADAAALRPLDAAIVRAQSPLAAPAKSSLDRESAAADRRSRGAVCTIRVIRANPEFDAGILHGARKSQPDPIVRDDVAGSTR